MELTTALTLRECCDGYTKPFRMVPSLGKYLRGFATTLVLNYTVYMNVIV